MFGSGSTPLFSVPRPTPPHHLHENLMNPAHAPTMAHPHPLFPPGYPAYGFPAPSWGGAPGYLVATWPLHPDSRDAPMYPATAPVGVPLAPYPPPGLPWRHHQHPFLPAQDGIAIAGHPPTIIASAAPMPAVAPPLPPAVAFLSATGGSAAAISPVGLNFDAPPFAPANSRAWADEFHDETTSVPDSDCDEAVETSDSASTALPALQDNPQSLVAFAADYPAWATRVFGDEPLAQDPPSTEEDPDEAIFLLGVVVEEFVHGAPPE